MPLSVARRGTIPAAAGAGPRRRLATITALIRLDLISLGWRDLAWWSLHAGVNAVLSVLVQDITYFSIGIIGLAGTVVCRVLMTDRGHQLAGLHCSLPVRREEVVDARYCLVIVMLVLSGAVSGLFSLAVEGWGFGREVTCVSILLSVTAMMAVMPGLTGAVPTGPIGTVVMTAFPGTVLVLLPVLVILLLVGIPLLQSWPAGLGAVVLSTVAVALSWSVSRRRVRPQEY